MVKKTSQKPTGGKKEGKDTALIEEDPKSAPSIDSLVADLIELQTKVASAMEHECQRLKIYEQNTLEKLARMTKATEEECTAMKEEVRREREALEAEKEVMAKWSTADDDIIELNVGGTHFDVLRHTLCLVDGSLLASLFSGRWEDNLKMDKNGRVFLNFDPATTLIRS